MKEEKKDNGSGLTPEQLKKLKKEVGEAMSLTRHRLLKDMPFVGDVAMRFDLVPVRDARCRTACTDAKSIYWDCDFFSKLSPNERVFVMAHEIWHCVMLHFARCQTRDRRLFNVATDMEVNSLLADGANGRSFQSSPPKDLLFPPDSLKGKSAEAIYDWLLKQQERKQRRGGGGKGGKSGSGGMKGDSGGDREDDGGDREEDRNQGKGDGKKSGRLEGQFDQHNYGDEGEQEKGEGKTGVKDQWGDVGYDDDYRPSVPQDAAERMREAAISAAQSYQREYGKLPAGIEGIVGKLSRPEIRWQEELAMFVTQCYGGKRQWLPPNRRHVYNDMYFQSRRNERVNVCVAIDTSGSTTGELPKFFGELKGLVDSFGAYTITLIECDAAVDRCRVYDENDPLDLEDVSKIEYTGGGGTSFDPPFLYLAENGINVDMMIYLTDGYGPCTVPKPAYPVMWLVTKDGTTDFCDWGKKVRFRESAFES